MLRYSQKKRRRGTWCWSNKSCISLDQYESNGVICKGGDINKGVMVGFDVQQYRLLKEKQKNLSVNFKSQQV